MISLCLLELVALNSWRTLSPKLGIEMAGLVRKSWAERGLTLLDLSLSASLPAYAIDSIVVIFLRL
jgi:hypothetical protein